MSDTYRFTIQDDVVIAVYEWDDGRWEQESIDSDESYYVENGVVYKQEFDDGREELTAYIDSNNDGIYQESQSSYSSDGSHSDDDHYEDDHYHDEDDDHYYDDYEDDHSDGDYSKDDSDDSFDSSLYQVNDSFATDQDDQIILESQQSFIGGAGADSFIVTFGVHTAVADFNADEGDKLVFDTGLGLETYVDLAQYVVQLNYQNEVLYVDFGELGEIELTGVRADQISWDLVDVVS